MTRGRHKRLRWAELALALIQTVYGTGGAVLSQLGVVGGNEPKLVLHLSWAALAFTGMVGLIVVAKDWDG